jgi:hypothetical protein
VAKIKYALLIPLNFQDGSTVPDEVMDQILDDLYVLGDGYTTVGTGKGAYRMKDGSKQIDHTSVIWIGVEEEQESTLKRLVSEFAHRLGQESIYLEKTGGTIEFIPPPSSGEKP